MIAFEHSRSSGQYFYIQRDADLDFGLHLHNSFECVFVTAGELVVGLETGQVRVPAGQCALLFPNQAHAYRTPAESKSFLLVYSQDYVSDYYESVRGFVPADPVFSPGAYTDFLRTFDYEHAGPYALKSVLYLITDLFDRKAAYVRPDKTRSELLGRAIQYVETHYMYDISLRSLALELGYNYNYASSLFHKSLGVPFPAMVNEYRITMAKRLLIESDYTIARVATDCGYDSIRSFNRNFTRLVGRSPTDFKRAVADQA